MGLYGYPHLNHLLKVWPGDWVKKMSKMNEAVGENNGLDKLGGKRQFVHFFQRTSTGNLLVELYWKLHMGRKETSFRVKLTHLLVRKRELQYIWMFVGRNTN